MRAFAAGCQGEVIDDPFPKYKPGICVVWGLLRGAPEVINEADSRGDPWFYVDHGYVGRGHTHGYYRVTYKSHQKTWVEDRPSDRWDALNTKLKAWHSGADVVIVPPSPMVSALFGPIIMPETGVVSVKNGKPVLEKFPNAKVIVTWNSIAAVEGVIGGVPCVVYGESAAKPMASPSVNDLLTPERSMWANSLAYGQFLISEMESGKAWKVLKHYL